MSDTPYLIVDSNSASDLANAVNHFIRNGYRPIGGPFVDPEPEFLTGRFKQAMLLEDRKDAS